VQARDPQVAGGCQIARGPLGEFRIGLHPSGGIAQQRFDQGCFEAEADIEHTEAPRQTVEAIGWPHPPGRPEKYRTPAESVDAESTVPAGTTSIGSGVAASHAGGFDAVPEGPRTVGAADVMQSRRRARYGGSARVRRSSLRCAEPRAASFRPTRRPVRGVGPRPPRGSRSSLPSGNAADQQ
jgi:hypothetical protein